METDELIAALAADDIPPRRPQLVLRSLAGCVLAALLMILFWGIRADWAQAAESMPVLIKQGLPIALALIAGALLLDTAPERPLPLWPFAAIAALAALAWAIAALSGGDVFGRSAWQCLASIPFLALPLAVLLFAGLRHRIEPDPARAGMMAGLFAGALGAAIYAFHCNEDSAAFFLLWYGLAIAVCGAAGRLAGARMLGI